MNKDMLEKLKTVHDVQKFVYYLEPDASSDAKKGQERGAVLRDFKGDSPKKLVENFEAIQQYGNNIGEEFGASLTGIEFKGEVDNAVCYFERSENHIEHLVVIARAGFDVKGFLESLKENKNSEISPVTTPAPVARKLYPPIKLKVDRVRGNEHLLTWEANNNETGTKYLIERAISKEFYRGSVVKPDAKFFEEIHVEVATIWQNKYPGDPKDSVYYRIRATDGRDFSDYCEPESF